MSQRLRPLAIALLVGLSIAAFVAITLRLRLDPNVAALLPDSGNAAAMKRYVRGFGGGDLGVVMVKGPDATDNAAVAAEVAEQLRKRASVEQAADRVDTSHTLDPMLAWRHADARSREKLAKALSPEGMRTRLQETRAMLLAPGSSAMADVIAQDPLRLAQLVFESADVGAGVRTQPDGAFATDDGKMCLVLVKPKGQALRGEDARAFVADVNSVLDGLRPAHPQVEFGLTGGHAIAAATEKMLERDLTISGSLSMILASVVFALLFRRVRALLAVMPPLLLGTIWTAGCAAALPGGLSAIAVAFMSVVVGVGVDTGVHVYAALLEARRAGHAPAEAASIARKKTARAVLFAATTAAAAFAALAMSDIRAVRQLGILCAAGEVLTAVAIVLVTPEIGKYLEKGPPPPPQKAAWTGVFVWLTGTRARAAVLALVAVTPLLVLAITGAPPLAEAIVAIRPKKLEPLRVQQQVFDAFGGKRGQWVVLVADRDLDTARARGDKLGEALAALKDDVESVDSLSAMAPALSTQSSRLAERDTLYLPARGEELSRALTEVGFSVDRFEDALASMKKPSHQTIALDDLRGRPSAILMSRYLGFDEGEHLVGIYVRPRDVPNAIVHIEETLSKTDSGAVLTGYTRLESSLRESLSSDIPKIALVAALLVIMALAASLRSVRDVVLAAMVVLCEVAAVLLLLRVFSIPLHAYSALVIPVLLGITVDEGMFLLHRARTEGAGPHLIAATLKDEGPPIAATALTTAVGFGSLAFCDFDGLRDLGLVGAIGSTVGLFVALSVVPAGLRLFTGSTEAPKLKTDN
ncbi:MAG: MMPL family transporter [Polyangiaceae bacterium]|nr:MMPL family transporter [Polyangiaceae bacterium]